MMLSRSSLVAAVLVLLTLAAGGGEAQERPRILLVNDDGIGAEGIAAMATELRSFAEVVVVAPDGNASGASHSSTIRRIRAELTPLVRDGELFGYGINATPADATRFGILHFGADRPFDLVISGINDGANTGDIAHYSGTVGAAMEALLHGIPAIATSQDGRQDFARSARISAEIARRVLRDGLPPGVMLSVNVPRGELRGVRAARMGGTYFGIARFEPVGRDGSVEHYRAEMRGAELGGGDTDTAAYLDGYVTITPLRLDWTDDALLEELGGWRLDVGP